MVVVDISGARALVAGATGVLGGGIARALHGEGAHLALAGRDERKLAALADELGGVPISVFDALDLDRCAAAVDELVALVVDGIRTGRRELRYDLQKGEFAGR